MDANFENDFRGFPEFSRDIHTINTCTYCDRAFSPYNNAGGLDLISICNDCNAPFLVDYEATSPDIHYPERLLTSRTRRDSSESIESMLFSQQFSHLINLARQNQFNSAEFQSMVGPTSSRTTPSGSRRWSRSVVSDTESDGLDSLYGESESNISLRRYSYGPYYSDDGRSLIENENFFGRDMDSDTDIDPMNAGLYRWSSDEGEENEWEEEVSTNVHGPSGVNGDYFEEYLDGPGLENVLERLAEAEGPRRGAPQPTSASFVKNLPGMVVDEDGSVCVICKDSFVVGSVASRLPCSHLFHPSCILPWLSTRNTCPLCRHELPTDDRDYEAGKRDGGNERMVGPRIADYGGVVDGEGSLGSDGVGEQGEVVGDGPVRSGVGGCETRNRWLFIVAPIVGILGVSVMLCLGGKSLGVGRWRGGRVARPRENGQRRWWWSLF